MYFKAMPSLIRPNYFNGQLLTQADFQLEQDYLIARSRRHNLIAHGIGIAKGLVVSTVPKGTPPAVVVSPGAAIDPAGNEIELDQPRELIITAPGRAFCVVIRQVERPINPVPARTADGVAFTQIEEDCEIALLADGLVAGGDLVLARFVKIRAGWRRDPKVKQRRLR